MVLLAIGTFGCGPVDDEYDPVYSVLEPRDMPPDIEMGLQPISASDEDEVYFDHSVVDCRVDQSLDGAYESVVYDYEIQNPLDDAKEVALAISLDVPEGGSILNFIQVTAEPGRSLHRLDAVDLPGYGDLEGEYLSETGACSVHFLAVVDDPQPIANPIVDSFVFRTSLE